MISSHLLHDLERVCDQLILLSASRTQICGAIDELLAEHRTLVGPRRGLNEIEPGLKVIKATQKPKQTRLLVRVSSPILDPSWEVDEVGLEDIVLAYMELDGGLAEGQLLQIGTR